MYMLGNGGMFFCKHGVSDGLVYSNSKINEPLSKTKDEACS
jgi:hypothetical protein